MKHNWVLIAAICAVLAVPFGLALFEDATADPEEPEPVGFAPEEEPELEPPPEPTDDDVVEWERDDPLDLSFIDRYLAPDRPGLRSEITAVVTLDEPLRDAARVYEARFNGAHDSEGLSMAIEPAPELYTTGPVASVTLTFPGDQQVIERLGARWGPPVSPTSYDQPCAVWTDAGDPVRAVLDRSSDTWTLMFTHYRTFEELLSPNVDGSLALEPRPLVGAEIEDIKSSRIGDLLVADEDHTPPSYTLLVNPSAFSRRPTLPIELITYAGEVTEISATIDMSCDRGAARRALSFLGRELGGVADTARVGEGTEVRFNGRPDLTAFVYSDRVVMVRRARK